jgi:hypothetical protein
MSRRSGNSPLGRLLSTDSAKGGMLHIATVEVDPRDNGHCTT